MDNLSLTVKERILLIAGHAKLSKMEFFKDLGMSYANFKGEQKKSGLSSDALLKVLSKYPEINPSWLLLGEGEMLRPMPVGVVENKPVVANESPAPISMQELQLALYDTLKELGTLIAEHALHVQALTKRVELLEKKGKDSKKKKKKK
ncbi:hypothetical protein [Sphingobacterium yanglingense]|uniref:Uncharacterized protein n=1 Tax=Sphingobacterium yanglingense TaxID=1437280 RepID=A0A4R6W8U4_9SPHI|nr:hypothetical protein [Sphingobacterium yanglingense]TDQ75425.1 hypothetical protein CLV99_4030 [Sphingobacterium yanglingense]